MNINGSFLAIFRREQIQQFNIWLPNAHIHARMCTLPTQKCAPACEWPVDSCTAKKVHACEPVRINVCVHAYMFIFSQSGPMKYEWFEIFVYIICHLLKIYFIEFSINFALLSCSPVNCHCHIMTWILQNKSLWLNVACVFAFYSQRWQNDLN